ncbi:MAG: GTP-binding protein [Planctomycetota bacterium]
MDIVIVGHVDHGKSTLVGRLLADTDSLAAGRLDAAKAKCAEQGKPFEYASLLDALKDEQEHGITIDAARVFFRSDKRSYLIHDAPGHVEFVRNMVTGAARAEAAVLVVDVELGVQENTRRHAYLLGLLGIPQIVVAATKMDRVAYSRERFEDVAQEAASWLERVAVAPCVVLPVSGGSGAGVARSSENLWWFRGPTLLEALDGLGERPSRVSAPFRLPVQAVYKWVRDGDDRRILAGTIQAGRVRVGDEVVFYPSATRARVRTIEAFHRSTPTEACAGEATGLTIEPEVYVPRGSVVARADEPQPEVGTRLAASLFWLGRKPLPLGHDVRIRIDTAAEPARLESIERRLDAHTLEASEGDVR